MVTERIPPDIAFRLGDKKHYKTKLKKIAKTNGMTMQQLMIHIVEWFLEEKKKRDFVIKLK